MNADETIAAAKLAAEQHKTKRVLKAPVQGDKFPDYEHEPVKTVHVTMPGQACYLDLDKKGVETLNKRCIEKKLSIHEFKFETKATDENADEVKKTSKKTKATDENI